MKHRSTSSIISSLMLASLAVPNMADDMLLMQGPSHQTICSLQMLARTYHPGIGERC